MIIYLLFVFRVTDGTRKCRNWQTSKTKDLVSIALVWVQVPSSALNNRKTGWNSRSFCYSERKRTLNPGFNLRFAPVGAEHSSPGRVAPHLPHKRVQPMAVPFFDVFKFLKVLKKTAGMLKINGKRSLLERKAKGIID